ncbi:MAG: type II secretion system minor pseudopilin GspJ [Porticoccaceae bacterium]
MTGHRPLPPGLRGFSLVEMLVALMIMAIVSVLAWAAFDGVLAMESRSKEQFLAENRLQLAVAVIQNDLVHLRQRPARDAIGGQGGAYLAPWREFALVFTRGGAAAHRAPGGSLERIGYRVEEGRLIRSHWQVVDEGPATERADQVLATGIDRLTVAQLDGNGDFTPFWPPANERLPPTAVPPLMRVSLLTLAGEEQVVLIPGPDNATFAVGPSGGDDDF